MAKDELAYEQRWVDLATFCVPASTSATLYLCSGHSWKGKVVKELFKTGLEAQFAKSPRVYPLHRTSFWELLKVVRRERRANPAQDSWKGDSSAFDQLKAAM